MISELVAGLRLYVTIWQTIEAASARQSSLADGEHISLLPQLGPREGSPGRRAGSRGMEEILTKIPTIAAMLS